MGAACTADRMDQVKAKAQEAKDKHDGKPAASPTAAAASSPSAGGRSGVVGPSGPPVVVDTSAGIFLRRDAPQLPPSRYPDGFTLRVTEARAMHDPKDKENNIQVYNVCVFVRGAAAFDTAHARNKRWKTIGEFDQLHSQLSGQFDGASAPSLPSMLTARKERSKILMEERRVGYEAYLAGLLKVWYTTQNLKFRTIIARWLNFHMDMSYVQHLNLLAGVDRNTAEYINPADAKEDQEDGMFGAVPKVGMPSLSMPKLSMPSMPKLSMPSFSLPNMSSFHMPSLPSLPSLGDTPADIAKRQADAAACLAERQENQLAYLDSLNESDRAHHVMARQLAWIQQNGNGWTWSDPETKAIDHWVFDRELQTATRTINTRGTIKDSEDKTVWYWDEPVFVSGDIFELRLTKKQSKPGVLHWNSPDEDAVRTIRIKIGTANNRIIDVEFHGKHGAEMCQGSSKTDTRKTYSDGGSAPSGPQKKCAQHEHPLTHFASRYGGNYVCNICRGSGTGEAYACDACKFDVHPKCLA